MADVGIQFGAQNALCAYPLAPQARGTAVSGLHRSPSGENATASGPPVAVLGEHL